MTVWIDEKKDVFEGCLLILNVGQENSHSLPKEYLATLRETIDNAHADGFLTIYAFGSDGGPMRIPEDFGNINGMDCVRMMFDVCGRKNADFSLDPIVRRCEFREMADCLRQHKDFGFKNKVIVCGSCRIDSSAVLLPPMEA